MIDPEWEIICSGLIDRNDEGLLPPIDVEFPQGSGWYWTLCAAEPSNELSQPNLVLTFEDKIVRTLKEHWGEKRAKAGYNIRAEFIRELCVEAGVKYVIPSVEGANERRNKAITVASEAQQEREATNTIERLAKEAAKTREASAEGAAEATVALTPEAQATAEAKGLKEPGLGVGSPVTVKHVAATPSQIKILNEALAVATEKGAGKPELMSKASMQIVRPTAAWLKLNASETGLFRTSYDKQLLGMLRAPIEAKELGSDLLELELRGVHKFN